MRPALAVLVLITVSPWASVAQGPAISVEAERIVALGLTPGGQAALIGVVRQPVDAWHDGVTRRIEVLEADSTGEAILDLGEPVPWKSVWAVAELASAEAALGAPEGFAPKEVPRLALDALEGSPTTRDRLRFAQTASIDLLVVRRGVGAWHATPADGTASDLGEAGDGAVEAAIAALVPLGSQQEPVTGLRSGDLLVVLDPLHLAVAMEVVP